MYTQNLNVHTHNTRQKHHLHVSTGSSDFYTKSFYCSSILIWNDIMKNVDVSVSLFKFKKKLKLYLLNKLVTQLLYSRVGVKPRQAA